MGRKQAQEKDHPTEDVCQHKEASAGRNKEIIYNVEDWAPWHITVFYIIQVGLVPDTPNYC